MDATDTAPASPSQMPASHIRHHHPYFTPSDVEKLSEHQRGWTQRLDKAREQACGFIEAVGSKIGLYVAHQLCASRTMLTSDCSPRKTIATAQTLYHRFHLFFPKKDFTHYVRILVTDIHGACAYDSCRM